MKKIKKAILIIMISLISYSGMAQWQLAMQEGGNIYTLVEQNNVIFAGTLDGVFKSDDGGNTWTIANNGLANTVVHAMIVNNSRLFAGTEAGVFISDDGGNNWTESNQGLTISKINSFVLTNTGIFAGTDDQGIFYSSDNGANWVVKNTGLGNLSVRTLTSNNGRVFAGTYGAGVYYSDNLGNNWTQSNNGLTSWYISHLTIKDNKLFVSTIYKLYISENNGIYWNLLNTTFEYKVLCSVNYNDYMFVGTDGSGVAYTNDYGQTWTIWNEGLNNKNMYSIGVFGNNVWSACCCGYGLFKRLLSEVTSSEEINNNCEISISPNPASDVVTITLNIKDPANASIKLSNIFGISLWNNNKKRLIIGEQQIRINTSTFSSGIYFIIININGHQITKKIIIQN